MYQACNGIARVRGGELSLDGLGLTPEPANVCESGREIREYVRDCAEKTDGERREGES